MRYLYKRGKGARRRKMHLCGYDERTGEPTMRPLCGIKYEFDTTCNFPLGLKVCGPCSVLARRGTTAEQSPAPRSLLTKEAR